jgi:hypothetical protein
MQFMNDYDLDCARSRFGRGQTPNRLALVMVVDNLREWADSVSDGWAYWPKPARAADKAMTLINSRTSRENDEQERHDITEAEMLAAVRPIKAFLTKAAKERHGLHPDRALVTTDEREQILRAVTV